MKERVNRGKNQNSQNEGRGGFFVTTLQNMMFYDEKTCFNPNFTEIFISLLTLSSILTPFDASLFLSRQPMFGGPSDTLESLSGHLLG